MTAPRDGRWVAVGRVGRPHGRRGAFVVEEASDAPERFRVGGVLYVDGEPVGIEEVKRAGGRRVIRVDRPLVRGDVLEVSLESLPDPEPGSYYAFQLVGLAVESDDGRPVGRVQDVTPGVANDVVELDTGLLLPLVEACVLSVDLDRHVMIVERAFVADG